MQQKLPLNVFLHFLSIIDQEVEEIGLKLLETFINKVQTQ